jgi:hypothetical protein
MALDGAPGDVLYFPSRYWHVAEDSGRLSLSISVDLFVQPEPTHDVLGHADPLLGARLGLRGRTTIDAVVQASARALRSVSADAALAQALTVSLLNRSTAAGFDDVPAARRPRRLGGAEIIQGNPQHPIRWTPVGGELVCSANGHACSAPRLRAVTSLLARLNAGAPMRVDAAVRDQSGTGLSSGGVRALLEKLYAFRAIEIVPGP